MIVDGSADVRSALGESVTRGGLLLAGTAISERTASAKFESYRPHVVVIDLVSREVGGRTLLANLRQRGEPLGFVLLVE
ncbi:MAG: hypothetical protein KDE27_18600, partial [Planctomycetes bacterium]|nr:hypothetical protein [Planctomycetota bacterium]